MLLLQGNCCLTQNFKWGLVPGEEFHHQLLAYKLLVRHRYTYNMCLFQIIDCKTIQHLYLIQITLFLRLI